MFNSKNGNQTESNRDYSISFARLIAMCFIVACHIMQRDDFASDIRGAHIGWAWWFNVGVQMFLFISGYLYGMKGKINAIEFYKKCFPKILVDYYVFIAIMIVAYKCAPFIDIDRRGIERLLTVSGTFLGIEHLWFIPTILFCYFLTPILIEVINVIEKHNNIRFVIEIVILLLVVHIAIKRIFGYFTPAWINCYIIGMIYSKIEKRRMTVGFNILSVLICLIIIPIQFRIDYWPHGELPMFVQERYGYVVPYGHVFLGIVLVMTCRFIYDLMNHGGRIKKHYILNLSDRYSYDIYLVHHVFIQSAFGCVEFISNRWVAIPLAILLTIISAVLLNMTCKYVRKGGAFFLKRISDKAA